MTRKSERAKEDMIVSDNACHYFCPVLRVGIVGKKLSAAKMSTRSTTSKKIFYL